MDRKMQDEWRQRLAGNPVIARLQRAAGDLLGGALLVLLRQHDKVIELDPPDGYGLPQFCGLYRKNPTGMECCLTCRSAMTSGACYRGTIEYSCHGGVIIIACPVPVTGDQAAQPVIASCAFAREDREAGWIELRDHAKGLGIDLRKMRAAYDRMPVLTDERRRIAMALVETGAAAISCQCAASSLPGPIASNLPAPLPEPDIDELIESALYIAQTQSTQQPDRPRGALLVEQVQEMLRRNPELPFTVKMIAATARVSPNYFSTLFRQATGINFTDFLLQQRMALSQQLLRDLTLSIEQIAARAGFPDASYFTRRFRRVTGLSPTQWRSSV